MYLSLALKLVCSPNMLQLEPVHIRANLGVRVSIAHAIG